MRYAELEFRRLAVWGGGREGTAAIDALRARFPDKPLAWIVADAELDTTRASAPDMVVVLGEGSPDAELSGFEIVIKSPGLSLYRPDVAAARALGTRFTSGTAIWMAENAHARTICVTGTKGKSSTAALIAHLLRASGVRTGLAGNIGLPLLSLRNFAPADWYVIELSSFQTADLDATATVAVLTNLVEEHLDWHGSAERYRSDKLRLFTRAQRCVLPARLELPRGSCREVMRFGLEDDWHVVGGFVHRGATPLLALDALPLKGRHNAINICAALTTLESAGFNAAALLPHLGSFRPLPHRLQELGIREGILYVNDSISTTPAAALAAWECYRQRPVAMILGGYERGLNWSPTIGVLANRRPRMICIQGENGPRIAAEFRAAGMAVAECRDLPAAVALARMAVSSGGVVLLSPGAPSFPAFRDYTERGRAFAQAAGFDPASIADIQGLGVS
jgi:UDP-N-acetylmuramoylalanine--D-glutamate ligase